MRKICLTFSSIIYYISIYYQQTGTVNDPRDGKVYKTVKIGAQTWFAANRDFKEVSGCWAYDDDSRNVQEYGYLYNWKAAKTVCPTGCHLLGDLEWIQLTDFLGGVELTGGKMKETGFLDKMGNGNAANESGFNNLAGGLALVLVQMAF